jgi:hypothetical protein
MPPHVVRLRKPIRQEASRVLLGSWLPSGKLPEVFSAWNGGGGQCLAAIFKVLAFVAPRIAFAVVVGMCADLAVLARRTEPALRKRRAVGT